MVTDEQVRLMRRKRMTGMGLEAAAAAAGMSVRTAKKWRKGIVPSVTKGERSWRTREDPFVGVWETEVVPLLMADKDGKLEAKTIFEELNRSRLEKFESGQLRTLQRRIREWRAHYGAEREVFFPQVHEPGSMGSFDFTHASNLGVTVAGAAFAHMFFEFVLAFSGLRFAQLAFGETFEALSSGLQAALFNAKGVPKTIRLDNLSAATHELAKTGGRSLTRRFAALADHYGFRPSRITPGEGHENGVAEKAHHLLKKAIDQALRIRGSRDFVTVEAYSAFVQDIVEREFHAGNDEKIARERAALNPLPAMKVPEFTTFVVRVGGWSTINVGGRIYSVPSRLKGHEVEARVHADFVEVRLGTKSVERMPRLRGDAGHRVDYRHVIWSLVQKPGAFAAYRFREDLFPTTAFREAYDCLRRRRGDRADVEYVRILHLAASTTERSVEEALVRLLGQGAAFDYAMVKGLAHPSEPNHPVIRIGSPDLARYDELLAVGGDS